MTINRAEAPDMMLEDRAQMLRSIADHWNSAVYLYERGKSAIVYDYMISDLLLAGVARYAHPALSEEYIALYTQELVKAVNDLDAFECQGLLPESLDDPEYSTYDPDAVMSRLNSDIDAALAPLLYGVSTAEMCGRCMNLNAYVTTWRKKAPGHHLCAQDMAEQAELSAARKAALA